MADWWEDLLDKEAHTVTTRLQRKQKGRAESLAKDGPPSSHENSSPSENAEVNRDELPFTSNVHWTYPVGFEKSLGPPEEDWEKKSHVLIAFNQELIEEFINGYATDPFFKDKCSDEAPSLTTVLTPSHFRRADNGLVYFFDADWSARLCVPKSKVNDMLRWVHDSAPESANAGYTRFRGRLLELFFWPHMIKDAKEFCESCDVCQKIKSDHSKKLGALRPAHIPARPFSTVSLDLITGLLPSGEERYTAVRNYPRSQTFKHRI